ncbi:MAG TPA: carboxylesterase family protein, partial [Panacibacter sp.]|nr:carboxylesterase family protein [Panacibacter sp.]
KMTDLTLDIYLPDAPVKNKKLPLVICVHSGGFVSGDKKAFETECRMLNAKGFIAASVNYRLGRDDNKNPCLSSLPETLSSVYRAVQDLRAATRYLAANATAYGIDTGWIFYEGASAGAATCLETAYLTQDSADYYFHGSKNNLGLLKNGSNALPENYKIRGIASMWGALYSEYIITEENAIPSIFFHGELDEIIPWDIGHFYSCDNMPADFGSKALYERLTSMGVPSVAHIDTKGRHGVYDKQFCQDNIACFFESLMKGQPQKGWYTTPVSNCR